MAIIGSERRAVSNDGVRTVAIRWLAEAVHRQGDLYPYRGSEPYRLATAAREGIATQRRIQRNRPDGYRPECPVRQRVSVNGREFELRGRVDGFLVNAGTALVEEFKTTRIDMHTVHRHDGAVHWAQARLYAALLARECPDVSDWRLRLVYCHPDTDRVRTHEKSAHSEELEAFLSETLERLWPAAQAHHERVRNAWLDALGFPFASFRPHQRALARRCYRALRNREDLMVEAPTGSGKTIATIYPALRSLAADANGKLLFLTSRGTGARAAQSALASVDPERRYLRTVTITAKEKACIVAGMPCSAESCSYARAYYDKREQALEALFVERSIGPETLESAARRYEVCPFELSLDAAARADAVVCDYNYVFDPMVRLQRFMGDDEIDVLIDEAHQLRGRTMDMLSCGLSRATFKAARTEPLGTQLTRRLGSIDRALRALRRQYGADIETAIDQPRALNRAVARFLDEVQDSEADPAHLPLLRAAVFDASRWQRSEGWREAGPFEYLLDTRGHGIAVRSHCLDPSRHIRETLGRYRASIRFSGTLSPLPLHNQLHGLDDAPFERAASAFGEHQLAVMLVRDIDTYYRGREASVDRLVEAVHAVFAARSGHCLVAFPSYAYLEQFRRAAGKRFREAALHCQVPNMTDGERSAFLAALRDAGEPRLAVVVLGGVFAESVDLAEVPLAGVIAVGAGIPPPDKSRDRQRRYFDRKSGNGRQVAYLLPAMTRIVQAAGRLLRSPEQRGVICLIDPRIGNAAYRRFFPAHWRPRPVPASRLGEAVAKFWEGSILPADRANGSMTQPDETKVAAC